MTKYQQWCNRQDPEFIKHLYPTKGIESVLVPERYKTPYKPMTLEQLKEFDSEFILKTPGG